MKRNERPDDRTRKDAPKDVRDANENIRRAQGDDATGPVDPKRTGNKPRFDRDR